MFGAASIVIGGFAGLGVSVLMSILVSDPLFAFNTPEWWPHVNQTVLEVKSAFLEQGPHTFDFEDFWLG